MTVEEWVGKDNILGLDIWKKKYQHNNETFEEWLDRVSNGNKKLRQLIKEKKLLLGGRTLSNRGLDNKASYFNCYSIGFVEDNYVDIMQACTDIGLTFKAQGGQGLSLSKIRPKGTPIGDEYFSDGIIPFMKIYNEVTAGTSQGGSRKGALMMSLDARHKEAENFIKIKSQQNEIEKANLSLEIDDEFMETVYEDYINDTVTTLHEKRDYSGHIIEYDIVPKKIFEALVENCYDWGDPGVIFTNQFRNYNLMEKVEDYQIETCNPCGEQPLPKHGSCCLASINLSEFVIDPYTEIAKFDLIGFHEAVIEGIKALDELIDENSTRHPLLEQQLMSSQYRNIGLGVLGYSTMLMKLGVKYGEDEAVKISDVIFKLMFRSAVQTSNNLAKEKGTFPNYTPEIFDSEIMKLHFTEEEISNLKVDGLRNCSLLSIAPTGTIATMIGESNGIEPEFAIKYTRRTTGMTNNEDTFYQVYCKAAKEYLEMTLSSELPDYFVSSAEIPWYNRILIQGVIQRHIDTAISSTINLPQEATKMDIMQIYLEAWANKLKGITIFRNGCKKMGILTTATTTENNDRGQVIETSDNLVGKKRKLTVGCGSLHCTAFFDPNTGDLVETYLSKGSEGGCNNYMIGLSRLISLSARGGVGIEAIIDQLNSCGVCPSYAVRASTKKDTSKGSSCPIAVGYALKEMYEEMQAELNKPIKDLLTNIDKINTCPQCNGRLYHEGGCDICKECGYSKCY